MHALRAPESAETLVSHTLQSVGVWPFLSTCAGPGLQTGPKSPDIKEDLSADFTVAMETSFARGKAEGS